ncbi:unnamed protein product [Camellia sinensis]
MEKQLTTTGNRFKLTISDENVTLRKIQETHSPDGRVFDVKTLLQVVEDIFNRAEVTSTDDTLVLRSSKHIVETSETPSASFDDMPEPLAYAIDKISTEFSCKCHDGVDTHATTMSVLKMLTSYSWEAKMVLALAAFAVSYGEFWLVAQFQTSSQLAKSVGVLKQVHFILEKSNISKPQFDEIKSLLKDLLAITKCVVEFMDLSSRYTTTTTDLLDMSTVVSHIATATYWTIRSAVACAFQIASLMGIDHEHRVGAMEGWELPHLARKISIVHNLLSAHLYTFNQRIEEKKQKDMYELLVELFKTTQLENMTVFKVFFSTRDGLIKLLDGSDARKIRVNIEVLRAKHVLLLISNLEFPNDELVILEHIYTQSKQHQYEIVWVPIIRQDDNYSISWSDMELKLFQQFRGKMPWYSVEDPSLIQRAVVRYTREVWHFGKNPILVVVDPKGKVTCPNALHRMWIWGSNAFPFPSGDDDLWIKQPWNLEFLVADVDPTISSWITQGKYICLYGGDDMDWIKQFTTTARDVAQKAGISLEMVYVGKRNSKEKFLRTIIATINDGKLSHFLPEPSSIWYFWVRIESMWHSQNQLGKSADIDHVMHEIEKMMIFGSSEGGWALLSKGGASAVEEMITEKGFFIQHCFSKYEMWKDNVEPLGFMEALRIFIQQNRLPPSPLRNCSILLFPGPGTNSYRLPNKVECTDCGHDMEKFIMYRCCHDYL